VIQSSQRKTMAKRTRKHRQADTAPAEAMQIARGTQQPGQTKEQTRLIARGIQKGIEQYKKQQNARARELDKRLKKARQQSASPGTDRADVQEKLVYRQHWLPWVLLIVSWIGMAAYWLVDGQG
jgi:hypothetical protein